MEVVLLATKTAALAADLLGTALPANWMQHWTSKRESARLKRHRWGSVATPPRRIRQQKIAQFNALRDALNVRAQPIALPALRFITSSAIKVQVNHSVSI